jgi:hypothetical protein
MKQVTENPVELILRGERPPALYRLATTLNADHLVEPLSRQGWRGFYINGQIVQDKESFLRVASTAMEFPHYFGHNWDAFEESIRDLSWTPARGYVVIYDGVWRLAVHDRPAWQTARSILTDAILYWHTQNIPFYVLLSRTWWYARDIEKLV